VTAPPANHDAVFAAWLELLEKVNRQIHVAMLHRKLWTQVRDAVIARHPDADGTLINSYGDVYWDSQVMAVRRLADQYPDRPVSLWWLLERIRRNPEVVTRNRYVTVGAERYADEPDSWEYQRVVERHERDFTDRYGAGAHVDRARIVGWQLELKRELRAVDAHADQWIAHRDPEGAIHLTSPSGPSTPRWTSSAASQTG
jgi:hypothetical protein